MKIIVRFHEALKARRANPGQLAFDFGGAGLESPTARGLHIEQVQVGGAHPHMQGHWVRGPEAEPERQPAKPPEPQAWRSAADGPGGKGLRILSLFSGAGGLDLGLHRALPEAKSVGYCEIDRYAQQVLRRRFPKAPIHPDVRDLASHAKAGGIIDGAPNMVIGGFPCQDLSRAQGANAKGLEGERSGLYREMRDIIEHTKPDWVTFENVSRLRSLGLDVVLRDMEDLGYEITWDTIPASAVGGPHERERVFIVCHRPGVAADWQAPTPDLGEHWRSSPAPSLLARPDRRSEIEPSEIEYKMGMRQATYPQAHRETRIAQTCLGGNAVSPQVAELVGRMISSSRPGMVDLTGSKILARRHGTQWLSHNGEVVTSMPRAGRVRDGVIYERESKTPTQKLHAAIKEGDPIWVRNPDPNDKGWDEGETFWHSFLDISEDQGYVMQEAAMEGTIMGEDIEPEDLDDLVAKGYLKEVGDDEFEPTDWGAMVGTLLFGHDGEHRGGGPGVGGRYRGHGGADDEFQCYVEAIQTPGDPNSLVAVHDVNSGESYVLPMAYLTRYPTPAKSDWKGGFSEDLRKDHTQPDGRSSTADTARERRDRGRQLRHWVNGKVNPEFSEWLMGFPAGHFDAGFAPDDYKPT